MKIEGHGQALAIYIGETDHFGGKPLYTEIEDSWRTRFGADTFYQLKKALFEIVRDGSPSSPLLKGLQPYPDCWRAKIPQPSTLPHYPMVLHRGGYPDGS